ncbi:hypothetical protein evm_014797, partial [Chilo suppressalis]
MLALPAPQRMQLRSGRINTTGPISTASGSSLLPAPLESAAVTNTRSTGNTQADYLICDLLVVRDPLNLIWKKIKKILNCHLFSVAFSRNLCEILEFLILNNAILHLMTVATGRPNKKKATNILTIGMKTKYII